MSKKGTKEIKAPLKIITESEQILSQLRISSSFSSNKDLLCVEKYLKRTKKNLRIRLCFGFLEMIISRLFRTIDALHNLWSRIIKNINQILGE